MKQFSLLFIRCTLFLCISLFLFPTLKSSAQYENIWVFGLKNSIDFNSGTPQLITKPDFQTNEASAAVCDSNGQLLFYTNGTDVWDRTDNLMPNGKALINIDPTKTSRGNITLSTVQGALIVPMPGNKQKYYVFSLGNKEDTFYYGKLYYSIVDMSLNGGLGDVIASNKGTLIDTLLLEGMSAAPGNNCNVWLFVASRSDSTLKAYSINSEGISPSPVKSKRSGIYTALGNTCIDVSPDRSKLCIAEGNLVLYDFNPDSGKISNPLTIPPIGIFCCYMGVTFSPNSKILYGSGLTGVTQFNLSSNNNDTILASRVNLAGPVSQYFGNRRTPDGKIFIAQGNNISAINYPDIPGVGCQFVTQAFNLIPGTNTGLYFGNKIVFPITVDTVFKVTDSLICKGWSEGISIGASDSSLSYSYRWNTGDTSLAVKIFKEGVYW